MIYYLQKYGLLSLLSIMLLTLSFSLGYNKGSSAEKEKQLKIQINLQQQSIKKQTQLQIFNNKLTESYNAANNNIINLKQKVEDEAKSQQYYINKYNHINAQFVRILDKANSNNRLPTNYSSESANAENAAIPASQLLQWGIGIQEHDAQCVNQLNRLIDFVSEESNIINNDGTGTKTQ